MKNQLLVSYVAALATIAAMGASSSTALAGGPAVGFTFTANNATFGSETLTVGWASDPGAVFTVTRDASPGIIWNIDMTGSGHATLTGGVFPGVGFTMTWADPFTAGLYSNLTYLDDTHWRLETGSSTAANPTNGGFYGLFGNGVSILAGYDTNPNNDSVYASVSVVPTPAAAGLLAMGGMLAGRRRR